MASHNDRLPAQPSISSLNGSDHGDSRRLHHTQSNSASDSGRYLQRMSEGSSVSQQSNQGLDSSRFQQARQPINEAVTSAFNNTDASAASLPPEFLHQLTSQITANVLQQLKASNLPLPPQQAPGSHMETASSTAGSPPLDRATVYTPPSPHRYSDDTGAGQPSPQFPPPLTQTSHRTSSPGLDRRAVSPLSQTDHVPGVDSMPIRPKGPKRISTSGDVTILERVWGQLFTEQGQATLRLGQFLRGIALHIIEDYEPKNSLVITPAKLQRYYEETKLPNELYPWKVVFDDRTSSISRMYRDIECQHHLVQEEKLSERPDLPGLTPQGFETWAILLLKAFPSQEYDRLAKTALEMPISNPDERKERFPKELSRRLFPAHPDTEIAYKLHKVMAAHCNVNFPLRQGSAAEPQPRTSASSVAGDDVSARTTIRSSPEKHEPVVNIAQASLSSSMASIERPRHPYAGAQSESINGDEIENTEDVATPQPIERERKPYVAVAGGGKMHENLDKSALAAAGATALESKPAHAIKLGRSGSFRNSAEVPRPGAPPIAIHQRPPPAPMDIPESRPHRANSTYHRDPVRPGRNRSPSMSEKTGASTYHRHADPDVLYMSSSHHLDHQDSDTRRYRDYEAGRERLANDRYDPARMTAYDPVERIRDRERDGRPRLQSVSNAGQGFGDGPLSPTLRSSAVQPGYSSSIPTGGDEDYYNLTRVPTGGDRGGGGSSTHYNGHGLPASISTGFQPPPTGLPRDSSGRERDRDPGYYPPPGSAGYPPSSYRDGR